MCVTHEKGKDKRGVVVCVGCARAWVWELGSHAPKLTPVNVTSAPCKRDTRRVSSPFTGEIVAFIVLEITISVCPGWLGGWRSVRVLDDGLSDKIDTLHFPPVINTPGY